MIVDARVFDMEVPVLHSTCFDDSPFALRCREQTAEEIRVPLIDLRVSYVYVD